MRSRVRNTLLCCCIATLLLGSQAIAQEAAQQPAQEVTPDAASPDAASSDATSPNATAPDAAAPDAPAPPSTPAVVMTSPRIVAVDVDWNAARAALASFDQQQPAAGEAADAAPADALTRLNDATAQIFPKAAKAASRFCCRLILQPFCGTALKAPPATTTRTYRGFARPLSFIPARPATTRRFCCRRRTTAISI